MQVGDWVVSADGKPVAHSSDVWAIRDEIVAGARQHLLLETRRGKEARWYLLTK